MSAEINDGGPAFPFGQISEITGQPINGYFAPGMTLRDWFAGQALAGLVANINCAYKTQTFAKRALEIADAMIRARKGGTDGDR